VRGVGALLARRWQPLAALALLLLLFAQLVGAATQLSATIDEGFHITSGYEFLRTGRMRLLDEHVPLAKALFAWPLFLVPDLAPPEQASGYAAGDLIGVAQETVLAYRPIDRVIVACRIPVTLLTLLLAATVYRWAASWFGPTAGVLALVLLVCDPNVLAHGSLATTDLGATAFVFWAVWAFVRALRKPGRGRWWAAALLLGLAQGAKLTALLLLPVLGLLALVGAWTRAQERRASALLRQALSFAAMVAVAAVVLWGLTCFEVRPLPEVAGGRLPLPAAGYVERWLRLRNNIAYGRESFLLGQNGMHGWWQYFPIAFALKTPLPTLFLTVLAVAALALGRRRVLRDELALALFPVVYGALSLTSSINIGYRHLLPVLPFLFVSLGRVANCGKSLPTRNLQLGARALLVALLLWGGIGTLRLSPHYLAFFNEAAGGADEGYRFLADSNTDWGQSLKALAAYQRENDLGPVQLSTFTFLDPATYGVRYEPSAPMRGAPAVLPRRFNPQPGVYAISATTLDGVPLPLVATYDWFRHRAPLAKVGHVMFVYEVGESSGSWVAQCTDPLAPLTPGAITEGFGSETLRRIAFDCEQSWVFPDGGATPGWYVRATPGIDRLGWPAGDERLEWWPGWVSRHVPPALDLSYVQRVPGELPAFAIWEWQGAPVTPPASTGEVVVGDTLVLLGYAAPDAVRPGDTAEVVTIWRVVAPPGRPLSLMLHLSGADGAPLAVGDGLGVPVDQWRRGDIIVQLHYLPVPEGTTPDTYQVRSGAYWLDDMTRLEVGETDFVTIAQIQVLR
jgi:hypothetical protein